MNGIAFSPAGTTGPITAGTVTNSPGPTDAWITVKEVPFFGNVRIGSQKEWFSLEHLNSYRYLEFLERSYLFDFAQATAFNNGFSPGIRGALLPKGTGGPNHADEEKWIPQASLGSEKLDDVIEKHQAELTAILTESGAIAAR